MATVMKNIIPQIKDIQKCDWNIGTQQQLLTATLDFTKVKHFGTKNVINREVKSQPTVWEKIIANHL